MNHATHAASALLLIRVGTCIEVLSQWLPPVQRLMGDYAKQILALADWHQSQANRTA